MTRKSVGLFVVTLFGVLSMSVGASGAFAGEWSEVLPIPSTGSVVEETDVAPMAARAGTANMAAQAGATSPAVEELDAVSMPDGGTFAFWINEIGGDRILKSVTVGPDGATGTINTLSSPGGDAVDPVAVVAPSGRATVAWVRPNSGGDVVQTVSVSPGGSVGTVANRSASGNKYQNAQKPQLAVAPNSTVALVWRRFDGQLWLAQSLTIPEGGLATPIKNVSLQPIATRYEPAPGYKPGAIGTPVDPAANAVSPDVIALPDGTFKLAWIRSDEPLDEDDEGSSNVLMASLTNGGDPGEATALFVDKVTLGGVDYRWFIDSGGDPRGLRAGLNADGAVLAVWNRYSEKKNIEGDIVAKQRGAEIGALLKSGEYTKPILVSNDWANITNIEVDDSGSRTSATWDAETLGVKVSQWAPVGPSGRGGTFDVPLSPLGEFLRPDGGIGPGRWVTVSRYGRLADPGLSQAFVYNLTPNMAIREVKDLSGSLLKSSEQPQVAVDDLGTPTVVFYGTDTDDSSSLWFTRYSDPGISVSPERIQFDNGLLNFANPARTVTILSTGTTANRVSRIELTGPGADQYRLLDRGDCLGFMVANTPCPLKVEFIPTQAGPVAPAAVRVESEAGTFSTALAGQGVARTRLDLKVRPRYITARPGKSITVRVRVANKGGITATGVRVCFFASKRSFSQRRACGRIGSLDAGAERFVRYVPKIRRKAAQGRKLPVLVRLKVDNATAHRSASYVRVRPGK